MLKWGEVVLDYSIRPSVQRHSNLQYMELPT